MIFFALRKLPSLSLKKKIFFQKLGVLGDFVMQESFLVWDPKAYFKKGRERQVFLFELCVVFAKKTELSSRTIKYIYKTHLMASIFILVTN